MRNVAWLGAQEQLFRRETIPAMDFSLADPKLHCRQSSLSLRQAQCCVDVGRVKVINVSDGANGVQKEKAEVYHRANRGMSGDIDWQSATISQRFATSNR